MQFIMMMLKKLSNEKLIITQKKLAKSMTKKTIQKKHTTMNKSIEK